RHLGKQVGCDQFYLAGQSTRAQCATNGETVDRIYVDTRERGDASQQVKRLLKTFVLVLVTFDDADHFSTVTMTGKCLREAIRFLPQSSCAQATGEGGNL